MGKTQTKAGGRNEPREAHIQGREGGWRDAVDCLAPRLETDSI